MGIIYIYSQTCIKRSPFGQRKSGLLRGYIYMKYSMSGDLKGDLLTQVTA